MANGAASWQEWYDQYHRPLLLFARQIVASPSDAEDALQQGFVRFWKSRQSARDSVAYLFACVRSAALDARCARLSRQRHESQAAAQTPLLAGPPDLEDRRALLEAAIAQLPADQREVLVLKLWSDLTFAQIAEALAIPTGTAASRYRYALERLHTLLSPEVTP